MKTLTVSVLVCAVVTLTRAAALQQAKSENDQTAKTHLVKRSASCPSKWSNINGRCFLYVSKPLTWAKAEKNCQSKRGNLASIHSIWEYKEIQSLVVSEANVDKEAWIGGSDAHENNEWLWNDGKPFKFSKWCPDEPNNRHEGQHCTQINYGAAKCWDDDFCNKEKPSICVKRRR